jgi:Uma2 family endonuclease
MPERPRGVIDMAPDWVCEIVSPSHESKDTLQVFLLLQRHHVPFYWLIWPEDRTLIAHQLDGSGYRIIEPITAEAIAEQPRMRIPPFDDVEIDLAYILGE